MPHLEEKWTVDDGMIDIAEQAEMLKANEGTEREWAAICTVDEEGIAGVVALAHPETAKQIVSQWNTWDDLISVLERYIECDGDGDESKDDLHMEALRVLARAKRTR